ncbi:MAG: bifunctional (p)ppGpp synthetase/guanosine-3',5'-bis(diphosphate) 3'-pyrophosphohydrolase [Clostridia bacterium]|nr:bifunctional (p)ppGpp synthetase/guanosine-3',5'-bis(diphosphate) 3'-pyrophosphohydrolase [Clostridia bacterium]
MEKLTKAIAFAAEKHEGQTRKGSDTPYIAHPLEALAIAATVTNDQNVLMAAVLHDVVEDCGVSLDEIETLFGKRVRELVAADSEDKREDKPAADTWKIRKQETLDLIAKMDADSMTIVLADKLSNIRSLSRDYAVLGEALWQRFNCKDPQEHFWYYRSIADLLAPTFSDTSAWKEYFTLVYKTFVEGKQV